MPHLDGERCVVCTAHEAREWHPRARRHEVIFAGVNVEHRMNDPSEVDLLAAEREAATDETIFLIKPLYELAQSLGSLIRTVKDPAFHAHKILEPALSLVPLHHIHVFLLCQSKRHQRQENAV